jgi:uncharacterized protein (TIGR02145 family)
MNFFKNLFIKSKTNKKNIETSLLIQKNTFTDSRDGKTYKTVKIGKQEWMAENLAYLPSVYPSSNGSDTELHYYVYNYEGTDVAAAKQNDNYTTYGVLYNWPAAKAACPLGWHLPTDNEWKQLEMALGMTQAQAAQAFENRGTNQGTQMKAKAGWGLYLDFDTNTSGFSALPGGYRYYVGAFGDVGSNGYWWSSTEDSTDGAWSRGLYGSNSGIHRGSYYKELGFSVRCVRD